LSGLGLVHPALQFFPNSLSFSGVTSCRVSGSVTFPLRLCLSSGFFLGHPAI
jgi:hypothetical protein